MDAYHNITSTPPGQNVTDAYHNVTPTPPPSLCQIFTDAFHHVTPLLLKEGRYTMLISILVKE